MKVLAYLKNNSAPGYHRIFLPMYSMPDIDVFITNYILEEHFQGIDIFMYSREIGDDHLAKINEMREKDGFKICIDVDDFWQLDPHHILYDNYQEIDYASKQISHIRNADLVFTTHERLAAEIRPFNSNVHVLPNAIPFKGQFDLVRKPYHLTRLFWQGSVTHAADIALLQRPIECLGAISGKIKMIMGGYMDEEDTWYQMALDYTAKTKHQYALLAGLHVNEYYKLYEHADICLIPLVDSMFNRHKSNLKVLEAANLGLPVICSKVHPYMDLPVMYARSATDWVHHIQKLVASKKRQKDAGEELKEFCDINFNFDKINKERKQILEYQMHLI